MKNSVVFWGLLSVPAVLGVALANPDNPNNCQKPNPNKKVCIVTTDGVLDCAAVVSSQCLGTKQYEKKLFPDGAVGDPYSGRWTKDQTADCYRYADCEINELTNACQNLNGYGNWFPQPKTVLDLDRKRVCNPPVGGSGGGG